MLESLFTIDNGITLVTLTLLEIVLGIDNIVFLAILVGKLPKEKQNHARLIGLSLALVARVLLLVSVTWLMKMTVPLFALPLVAVEVTGKDLIMLAGGLFLIGKATHEIHEKLEGHEEEQPHEEAPKSKKPVSEAGIIAQIVMIDVVFSLDSVITAVGISDHLLVMIMAVIVAICIMMAFAGAVSDFVNDHPSIKMLALSFLILIGAMLVADAMHQHVPRGYVYFAMFFALVVEMLNIRSQKAFTKSPVVFKAPRLKKLQAEVAVHGLFTDDENYQPVKACKVKSVKKNGGTKDEESTSQNQTDGAVTKAKQ